MKTLRLSSLFLVLLAIVLVLPPARARAEVSFDFFYDNLAPYGEWVDVGDYGPCWRPTGVNPDWTPYTDGYWAYTDAGWTWVSYEDFGSIVYHYGRWVQLEGNGWCWVPEAEWAPAWVSWRYSDDYVGWAPLPPEVRWRHDVGISVWVDSVYGIGPGYYNFCRVRDFGAPVLGPVIINRQENVAIIGGTVNVTNITYNSGFGGGAVIFNGGPNFETINRHSEHPVPALKLVQNTNLDPASWRQHGGPNGGSAIAARTVGNQLIVAAPQVAAPADMAAFRSKAKQVIPADKVSKGWGLVKDRGAEQQLRQEIQRQAKGVTPESAPARPVAATDLKFVPGKADPHATVNAGQHEKPSKDQHKQGIAGGTPATGSPVAGNPALKPFNGEPEQKPGSQNPPTPKGSSSKPFTAETGQKRGSQNPEVIKGPPSIENTPQKQIGAQQEAVKAEDSRRRAQELQQQEQEQRATEARRGQDAEKEKEHARQEIDTKRPGSPPQHGNPPTGATPPSGAHHPKDSKDSKDSKDNNKNNGN